MCDGKKLFPAYGITLLGQANSEPSARPLRTSIPLLSRGPSYRLLIVCTWVRVKQFSAFLSDGHILLARSVSGLKSHCSGSLTISSLIPSLTSHLSSTALRRISSLARLRKEPSP